MVTRLLRHRIALRTPSGQTVDGEGRWVDNDRVAIVYGHAEVSGPATASDMGGVRLAADGTTQRASIVIPKRPPIPVGVHTRVTVSGSPTADGDWLVESVLTTRLNMRLGVTRYAH
jgi:hypothetical protein